MGRIVWTKRELFDNLEKADDKFEKVMPAFMTFWAQRVQSDAQRNASWEDQTGNARNGLTARYEPGLYKHSIVLFHRMPYGIWLETRWSGRYAIIMPTVRKQGPEVMRGLSDLLARLS